MARRAEEEINHWPGFVDALSTIVMVVTFLLIILGIVIFVISLQIQEQSDFQGDPVSQVQVEEIAQELLDVIQEANQLSQTIEVQAQEIEEQQQRIETREEEIQAQELEIQLLAQAADQARRDAVIENLEVAAQVPVVEAEIVVPGLENGGSINAGRSAVETAQAVMTVLFEENTVELDENSKEQALAFLEENNVLAKDQNVEVISYYDGNSLSVSQAKRIAYYRLLSVRNSLLDSGIEGGRISIGVRSVRQGDDESNNVNRVKVFLQ